MCTRIHISRGYTYHCDNGMTQPLLTQPLAHYNLIPRSPTASVKQSERLGTRLGALFKAPDSRIQGGSYFLITLRANWIRPDSFLVDFCLISGYLSAWGLNLTKYNCLYSPRFLTWLRPQLPLRQKCYHLWSWFLLFQFSNLNIYLYWLCIVDSTSLFLSRRGVVIFSFCQSGVDVEKLWTVFGDIQKNINNAYKNISSALCPHSLLVVSIISDGSQELVAMS